MIPTDILIDAIRYLQKVYVGRGEEERLVKVVSTLNKEIGRRTKNDGTGPGTAA